MIEVNEEVEVACTPRTVWNLLSDPHRVVDCVTGAALGEEYEDGTFEGIMTVQFGPVKVTFRGRIALEIDDAAMIGHVTARGKDKQGTTRFHAKMTFKVDERKEAAGVAVPIDASVEVSGRLASIVETGAKFVVKRLLGEFSQQLAARCATAHQASAS